MARILGIPLVILLGCDALMKRALHVLLFTTNIFKFREELYKDSVRIIGHLSSIKHKCKAPNMQPISGAKK